MTVVPLRPRLSIGGSDCAAAAGIHPHTSAIELWCYLTGRLERPVSEAMDWGKRLEPLIDEAMSERGYTVMPAPDFQDPERPWVVGHPDGFAIVAGEQAIYERKTIGQWAHDANGGEIPLQYQAQAQWYMRLAGLRRTLFAFLVGGQRLEVVECEYEPAAAALLVQLAEDFLAYVRTGHPPPPDGSDSARETVRALYPAAERSKVVRLDADAWRWRKELDVVRSAESKIASQRQELESLLQAYMGDAELALSPHDTEACSWRNVRTRRVDTKALRAALPTIAEEYTVHTRTRRFQLL